MRVMKRTPTSKISRVVVIAAAVLVAASQASAQATRDTDEDWQHGTTLAGFVGAASPISGVDPAFGLSLGWEVTPRLGLEGRGTWFATPDGVTAFAAAFGARMAFESARPILPFVSAGVGFYRATFEAPSSMAMPRFYGRRMGGNGRLSQTFDDFLVTIGTGTEVFVSRHVALRPELTVLLVKARSDVRAIPLFGMHMAYHFESHPITP
jgi:Outer membrane protein beta-barrel domain